jgi:hypothetical protein
MHVDADLDSLLHRPTLLRAHNAFRASLDQELAHALVDDCAFGSQ